MEFIPLAKVEFSKEDVALSKKVIMSGKLVQGKYVKLFEERISRYLNVKYAVAVSSGTAALHLSLLAIGIRPGDEVIIPAFSFVATANVVEMVGAMPIFVDIDLDTFNIDTVQIERCINSKTKAIMPVHEFGLASDMVAICKIAKKYKLKIVEDAACALGAQDNGKFAGTLGDVGCFSFHPRKIVTSGEGGMVVTNNMNLAEKIRSMRNHGFQIIGGKNKCVFLGLNYRMTDFQAALLPGQLDRIEKNIRKRSEIVNTYCQNLTNCKKIVLPKCPKNKRHIWQTFHILVRNNVDRDTLVLNLKKSGVETNFGAHCIPELDFYKKKYKLSGKDLFPCALRAQKKGLALPCYSGLKMNDVKYVSRKIIKNI